ncbi:uncharacterized protein PAC_08277 [Phialocephala subalpina]|uniref:Fork-head domain-containing protein n=1 Tax=Phialocephala subalpina TaxID=576137 RepID=A0A1L7X044_9HELO|nr:uncharacterized protein PAC_08277 [Phialocephala subalpina]
MDSITSQSSSESRQGTRATRILPMEAGHGVHLIATCLLNAQTSQMSVAEIYEWLAQKYPENSTSLDDSAWNKAATSQRGFNGQESFVAHQREAHSRGATVSPTIYKGATVIHSTGAGSLGAPRAIHHRDELTNHVIGAESAAEAETEFAIRQDILVQGGEVEEEEGSLFVDEMPIEMPIATNDSENRRHEEGELDDSVCVSRAAAGDKTLKDA